MGEGYQKILLLGTGRLFLDCLEYVSKLDIPYEGFDMSGEKSSLTQKQARGRGLSCAVAQKEELFSRLALEEKKILLLSVINPVLLPAEILKKKNIRALNCHQALLPRHRGRNAESWAIYEGDSSAGITWHTMTEKVDRGEILAQKEVPITEETTAYKLFRQQIRLAYEAFTEFMPEVLAGREVYHSMEPGKPGDFHYSCEVPAGGILDPQWSGAQISRFLRGMDYGMLQVLGQPKILVQGQEYRIKKYQIQRLAQPQADELRIEPKQLVLVRQDYCFILQLARL